MQYSKMVRKINTNTTYRNINTVELNLHNMHTFWYCQIKSIDDRQ